MILLSLRPIALTSTFEKYKIVFVFSCKETLLTFRNVGSSGRKNSPPCLHLIVLCIYYIVCAKMDRGFMDRAFIKNGRHIFWFENRDSYHSFNFPAALFHVRTNAVWALGQTGLLVFLKTAQPRKRIPRPL